VFAHAALDLEPQEDFSEPVQQRSSLDLLIASLPALDFVD
jgi:hypothetical protein